MKKKQMLGVILSMAMCMPLVAQAGEEPVTISVLSNVSAASHVELYETIVNKYMEEHPNVTIEYMNGGVDYYGTLKTRINAGETPDVFKLLSVPQYDEYSDYIYDISQDEDLMAFYDRFDAASQASVVNTEGKICGFPEGQYAHGIIYNKEYFEKAGITEIPDTIDELREACEKLVAVGITPFLSPYKEAWIFKHQYSGFMGAGYPDIQAMRDGLNDGSIKFADMEYLNDMFDLLELTIEYGVDKPLEIDAVTGAARFANGEAAMFNGYGDWCYSEFISTNPEIQLGMFPEPIGNNEELAKLSVSAIGCIMISNDAAADPAKFAAAKDFVMYMWTYICKYATDDFALTIEGVEKEGEVNNTIVMDTGKYIEAGMVRDWTQNVWPVGFEEALGATLQEYVSDLVTREEAIESIQEAWDKLSQ